MSFSEDLKAVAEATTPDQLPNSNDLPSIVGALVVTLEHAGIKVAEELLPKPVEEIVAPAAGAVEQSIEIASADEARKVIADAEAALARFEGEHAPPATDPTAPSPAPPPAPAEPSTAEPVPPPTDQAP